MVRRLISNIAFLAVGMIILISAVLRARYLGLAGRMMRDIESEYGKQTIDMSGETSYTDCYSQEWVLDNLTTRKYGRFYTLINDKILDDTLYGFMFLALAVVAIPLFMWSIILSSPTMLWTSMGAAFIGMLILYGTGPPKMSEELLVALEKVGFDKINSNDYPFVVIARDQILVSIIVKIFVSIGFLILVPTAEDLPTAFAWGVAQVANTILWVPVTYLEPVSILLALVYLSAIIPLLLVIIGKFSSILIGRVKTSSVFHVEQRFPPDVERFRDGYAV